MQNPHDLSLSQKQSQRLTLSPQMQRALHVLQLPVLELSALIEEEIEQNPLLEYAEEDFFSLTPHEFRSESYDREENDVKHFIESTLACENSLFNHLMFQLRDRIQTSYERKVGELIIGYLDEHGFLSTPIEEISLFENVDVSTLKSLLKIIQTFDPIGIGAKNLQESLLIQLKMKGKKESLAFIIIEKYFEAMLKNHFPLIAKNLHLSVKKVREIIKEEISTLNLHPARTIGHSQYKDIVDYITPDVTIEVRNDNFTIEINQDKIPKVKFIPKYLSMIEDPQVAKEIKDYIRDKIHSGEWLLKTLDDRHKTLYRIVAEVVKKQRMFFLNPDGKLVSFMMKEVASVLSLHESTIVRAVANKYVSSSRGILPLRFFFTHGFTADTDMTSHSIKQLLQEMLAKEDHNKPLSDEMLAMQLKEKGFPCARRTVAKYRMSLGIEGTAKRRHHR